MTRVRKGRVCPTCKATAVLHDVYDAYYCSSCNIWLEPVCEDETCDFCKDRPEKPITNGEDK